MTTTLLFAGLALAVAVIVLYLGVKAGRRWASTARELTRVATSLETSFGTRTHRALYRSFDELMLALEEETAPDSDFRWFLESLRPALLQFHRRAMAGAGSAWEEIRDSFLEKARHPIRLTRGAAGWVVLIGLAGTVLGFLDVVPALREVVTEQEAAAPAGAEIAGPVPAKPAAPAVNAAGNPDGAAAAGRKLRKVLGSLQGVFLATFCGVFAAILLSVWNLGRLEPAFDRFAFEVEIFGGRWFVPLVEAPDTLLDDALRGELRSYFEEVSRHLDLALTPLVSQLQKSLEQMSGLATDFSGNIRLGVSTLESFHDAVGKLGGSAQGAVDQLVQIVKTSGDFVHEVEQLQQKGMERLSDVLSGPAKKLAEAAAGLEDRVGGFEGSVESLASSSSDIAQVLDQSRLEQEELQREVASLNKTLEGQTRAFLKLEGGFGSIGVNVGEGIRKELVPLFESLPGQLRESLKSSVPVQALSQRESGRTLESLGGTPVEQVRLLGDIRGLLNELLLESREARQGWAGRAYERIRAGSGDWFERMRSRLGALRR